MEKHGLKIDSQAIHTAITTEDERRKYVKKLLMGKVLPDGILFSEDFAAKAAMEEFIAAGVRIPQDIAVVGFVNKTWARCSIRCSVPSSSR